MQDQKVKAAKEFYESVGMIPEQIIDTIEVLGFIQAFNRIYERDALVIVIKEYYIPKYQVVVNCVNMNSGKYNSLINPRYANQIQQLINNTQ